LPVKGDDAEEYRRSSVLTYEKPETRIMAGGIPPQIFFTFYEPLTLMERYFILPTRYSSLRSDAIIKIGAGWSYWVWNDRDQIWVKDNSYSKEHEDGHLTSLSEKPLGVA
jgi:hypothetical protein